MHRATFATAQPVFFTKDLRHHAVHVATLGDAMTMTTMGTAYIILITQMNTDTRRNGFLARIKMYKPGDIARRVFPVYSLQTL